MGEREGGGKMKKGKVCKGKKKRKKGERKLFDSAIELKNLES